MKIDIAITYEHVNREFMMYQLLKCELESRGYKVKIFNNYRVDRWKMLFYNSKMTIVGSLRSEESILYFYNNLVKTGTKVINMQVEQIYGDSVGVEDSNKPEGENKNCYHVCWGEMSHKRMLRWGVKESKIIDAGPLHFDFLKNSLKDVYDSRATIAKKYQLDIQKKWCLFASDAWFEEHEDKFFDSHFSGYKGELRNAIETSYKELLQIFDTLLATNHDIEFIYRPHPSEEKRIEGILELENKYSNFHYIREESMQQWCVVIDKYLTWNSTSIVEAYIAGKPVYGIGNIKPMKQIGENITIIDEEKRILDAKVLSNILELEDDTENYCALNKKEFDYVYTYNKDNYVYMELCDKIEEIFKYGEGICLDKDKQVLYRKNAMIEIRGTFIHDVLYGLPKWTFELLKKLKPKLCNSFIRFRQNFPEYEPEYRKQIELKVKKAYESMKGAG